MGDVREKKGRVLKRRRKKKTWSGIFEKKKMK
jgi:hypothetical protein